MRCFLGRKQAVHNFTLFMGSWNGPYSPPHSNTLPWAATPFPRPGWLEHHPNSQGFPLNSQGFRHQEQESRSRLQLLASFDQNPLVALQVHTWGPERSATLSQYWETFHFFLKTRTFPASKELVLAGGFYYLLVGCHWVWFCCLFGFFFFL